VTTRHDVGRLTEKAARVVLDTTVTSLSNSSANHWLGGVQWSILHSGPRAFIDTIPGAPADVADTQRSRLARSTV
jgi:hypothetical protein